MDWLNNFTTEEFIIKAGLTVAVVIFYLVLERFLKHKADEKRESFFRRLYASLIRPVQALFFTSVGFSIVQQFGVEADAYPWVYKLYLICMIAGFSWLGVNLIGFLSDRLLRRFDISTEDNLRARAVYTQVRVMRRIVVSIIIILGIAAALMTFDEIRSLGVSLLASAGVAGIVIGLAAQKTIGNFFTGLQIAITQPIRIDDSVVVEGEWGWIEEINLTYVVVKIWDLRRLILPISYFVEHPFQNWTRTSASIIGDVTLYLDYTMPMDELREELDRILEGNALWNGNTKVVQVIDTKETTIVVRILVSAKNAPTAWDLRCDVREKLIRFIQAHHPDKLPRMRGELQVEDSAHKETKSKAA